MDDIQSSRTSEAGAKRKRRSSILKQQRAPRAPFSELEFNVATPTDTAKSRRVSFSRRTGVAEFVTNEATTTWKNFYEEHNKTLESSGNESEAKPPRPSVGHISKALFDQHFQDAEEIDLDDGKTRGIDISIDLDKVASTITGDLKLAEPINNIEMSLLTDQQSKVFGDVLCVSQIGELTDRIGVNFSDIQPLARAQGGVKDDLDEIEEDLQKCHTNDMWQNQGQSTSMFGDKDNSEYIELDFNTTNVGIKIEESDMSITDTIHSPKVQAVSNSNLTIDKKVNKDKDWVADKENILVVNPYVAPKESLKFAVNTESDKVLFFDGKSLKIEDEKSKGNEENYRQALLPNSVPDRTPLVRKTIVLNVNDDLPNVSSTANMTLKGINVNQTLYNDVDISITQAVPTNFEVNQKTDVNESDGGDLSITEAVPTNVILPVMDERKTVIYESDSGDISMTEAIPSKVLVTTKENKRQTILYDENEGDISMTQAIPGNIVLTEKESVLNALKRNHCNLTERESVLNASVDKCTSTDVSITRCIATNIILPPKKDVPPRQAIFVCEHNSDISLTKPVATNEAATCKSELADASTHTIKNSGTSPKTESSAASTNKSVSSTKEPETEFSELENKKSKKRNTIVFEKETGDVSITLAVPSNLILPDKQLAIVYDNKTLNICSNPNRGDGEVLEKTIIYEDETDNISVTKALHTSIFLKENSKFKNETFGFGLNISDAVFGKTSAVDTDPGKVVTLKIDENSDKETYLHTESSEVTSLSKDSNKSVLFSPDLGKQGSGRTDSIKNVEVTRIEERSDIHIIDSEAAFYKYIVTNTEIINRVEKPSEESSMETESTNSHENYASNKKAYLNEEKCENKIRESIHSEKICVRNVEVNRNEDKGERDIKECASAFSEYSGSSNKETNRKEQKCEEKSMESTSYSKDSNELQSNKSLPCDSSSNISKDSWKSGQQHHLEISRNQATENCNNCNDQANMQKDIIVYQTDIHRQVPNEVPECEKIHRQVQNDVPEGKEINSVHESDTVTSNVTQFKQRGDEKQKSDSFHKQSKSILEYLLDMTSSSMVDTSLTANVPSKILRILQNSETTEPKDPKKHKTISSESSFRGVVVKESNVVVVSNLSSKRYEDVAVGESNNTNQKKKQRLTTDKIVADVDSTRDLIDLLSQFTESESLSTESIQYNDKKAPITEDKNVSCDIKDIGRYNNDDKLDIYERRRASMLRAPQQSVVISRECLFQNISMAKDVLCNTEDSTDHESERGSADIVIGDEVGSEYDSSDVEMEDKATSPKKSVRMNVDVVKTLNFEDSITNCSGLSSLKKSVFVDKDLQETGSERDRDKAHVIPTYLKDVTDNIKGLMLDLVKPNNDEIPFENSRSKRNSRINPSTNTLKIQADLATSSQIDINDGVPSSHSVPPALVTHKDLDTAIEEFVSFREIENASKRYSNTRNGAHTHNPQPLTDRVLTFDPTNPLNNILIPVKIVDSYEHESSKKEENQDGATNSTIYNYPNNNQVNHVITEHMIQSMSFSSSVNNAPFSAVMEQQSSESPKASLIITEINSEETEVHNADLLKASSSLTLVAEAICSPDGECDEIPTKLGDLKNNKKRSYRSSSQTRSHSPNKYTPIKPLSKIPKRSVSPESGTTAGNTTQNPQIQVNSLPPTSKSISPDRSPPSKPRQASPRLKTSPGRIKSPKKGSKSQSSRLRRSLASIQKVIMNYEAPMNNGETLKEFKPINVKGASDDMMASLCYSVTKNDWIKEDGISVAGSATSKSSGWRPVCESNVHIEPAKVEEVSTTSKKDTATKENIPEDVVSIINSLSYVQNGEVSWESFIDSWIFRLLHGQLVMTVRLALNERDCSSVDPNVPVNETAILIAYKWNTSNDPVLTLGLRFAADSIRYYISRGCDRASDVPQLLCRAAALSRVAAKWMRAMHMAHLHLAFDLNEDGFLSLKVANVPMRSVWRMTMRLEMVVNAAHDMPMPAALEPRVECVVANGDHPISEEQVLRVTNSVKRDWRHGPRTIWKLFKYLKNMQEDGTTGV